MLKDKAGAIIFASGDLSRYAAFEDALLGVEKPKGTLVSRGYASDLTSNLNASITAALERLPDLAWVWVLADDHTFRPDILMRLLEHDLDVVSPLVLIRRLPFQPSLYFRGQDEEGLFGQIALESLPTDRDLIVSGEDGAPEFYASPAGMLLSRRALDRVGPPWFEAGKMLAGYINEDMWLNEKLHRAGFKPALDLTLGMGHITPVSIWPVKTPKGWKVDLRFNPFQGNDQ
jgi:hypothetical protein